MGIPDGYLSSHEWGCGTNAPKEFVEIPTVIFFFAAETDIGSQNPIGNSGLHP